MNTQFNALQAAVDGQRGFEFDPIRFDGKSGLWMLDGVQFTEARKVIIVVPTGKHKGIAFDAEGGIADETPAVRYTAAPPPQKYDDEDMKPSTSVTGVIDDESKRLVTVAMLTWSGRSAFARIISAFLARGMRSFPICELTSKLKRNDPHHNYMPIITPVDWVESGRFPDLAAPPVDAIEGPRAAALPTGDIVMKPRRYEPSPDGNQDGPPPAPPPIEENDRADAIDEDIAF